MSLDVCISHVYSPGVYTIGTKSLLTKTLLDEIVVYFKCTGIGQPELSSWTIKVESILATLYLIWIFHKLACQIEWLLDCQGQIIFRYCSHVTKDKIGGSSMLVTKAETYHKLSPQMSMWQDGFFKGAPSQNDFLCVCVNERLHITVCAVCTRSETIHSKGGYHTCWPWARTSSETQHTRLTYICIYGITHHSHTHTHTHTHAHAHMHTHPTCAHPARTHIPCMHTHTCPTCTHVTCTDTHNLDAGTHTTCM